MVAGWWPRKRTLPLYLSQWRCFIKVNCITELYSFLSSVIPSHIIPVADCSTFSSCHPCHYLARWVVVAAAAVGGAPGTLPFLYPHNTIKTSIFAQIKTVSHSCTSCRGCWLCNTIMCQVPHNHPRLPNPIQYHPV